MEIKKQNISRHNHLRLGEMMIKGENQSGQVKRRTGVKLIHKIHPTHSCTLHSDDCRLSISHREETIKISSSLSVLRIKKKKKILKQTALRNIISTGTDFR